MNRFYIDWSNQVESYDKDGDYVFYCEVEQELTQLRAESEARRVALLEKSEECAREWKRAENAEWRVAELQIALEEAKAILEHAQDGENVSLRAERWLTIYGDK